MDSYTVCTCFGVERGHFPSIYLAVLVMISLIFHARMLHGHIVEYS